MKTKIILNLLVAGAILCSCSSKGGSDERFMTNVSGTSGEVVVVINPELWDSPVGRKVSEVLETPVPALPQPEPMFKVMNINPAGFGKLFQTNRTLIFVNISDTLPDAILTYQDDVWAATQLVMRISGPDQGSIVDLLEEKKQIIIDKINLGERDRWDLYYRKSLSSTSYNQLLGRHKLALMIPANYKIDVDKDQFVWIANETPYTTQSVVIYHFPYNGFSYFGQDSIIALMNSITSKEVKGPTEGSFMVVEERFPMTYRQFRYRNRNWAELRGLWTLENGYMGGPFVTLVTHDEVNNRTVMLQGFVYAPKDDKRELLRQVEALIYSVKFPNSSEIVVVGKKGGN